VVENELSVLFLIRDEFCY